MYMEQVHLVLVVSDEKDGFNWHILNSVWRHIHDNLFKVEDVGDHSSVICED